LSCYRRISQQLSIGEKLAFVLDGKVISAPVVTVPVKGQTVAIVSEHLDPADYERIARRLQDLLQAEVS
jgi:preprotein translocase subunit SecD